MKENTALYWNSEVNVRSNGVGKHHYCDANINKHFVRNAVVVKGRLDV